VGPFLAYSAEHCFVIVDHLGSVCGYVMTAPNANSFCDSVTTKWIPYLQQKYPLPETSADQSAAVVWDIIVNTACTMDALVTVIVLRYFVMILPSVLWRCWLGGRKGIRPVKNGMVEVATG